MIKIICVGKMKSYQDELKNYLKQIPHQVQIIEIKDEALEANIVKEEKAILKHLNDNSYIVLLAIEGKQYDSIEFSSKISSLIEQNKEIIFIIGGSYGVTLEVKKRANELLSFSKMTFPHQLMRLIFLEQLYRAFKIKENHPYHKWGKLND